MDCRSGVGTAMRGLPPIGDRSKGANGNCSANGKLCYRTRKKALKAPHGLNQPHAVYRCMFCDQWHMTTQEQQGQRS
jgi:hypothetical protein